MSAYFTAAVFAAAILFGFSAAAEPPGADAFGSLPRVNFGRLSPDGKHLAVIRPVDGREKIAIYDLTKKDASPYIVGMDGALAADMVWKGNDRVIGIFHANLKHKYLNWLRTWSRAISITPSTQTAVLLMYNVPLFKANYNLGNIVDIAANDPDHVYMTAFDQWDREISLDLYRVNLASGGADLTLHGDRDTIGFLSDSYGHVLGQIDQDDSLTNRVFLGAQQAYKYQVKGSSDFSIQGLVDGKDPAFAVTRPTPYGTTGLYKWTPSGGFGAALFENANYDVDDVIQDERTGRIIGLTYVDDRRRAKYFDPGLQRIQDSIEKAFPGQSVAIVSFDEARTKYVIRTEGANNPPVLSLFTTDNHQVNEIEQGYDLKPSDLSEVRAYPYKARDGLDIHAYLTLPHARDAHNLPLVVFPHGGPEARDELGFDWWAQFMASRGYAVLQPNYRGSSGYGWNFIKAGDAEWTGKVQADLEDGVQKLVAEGIVDPKRVCIVGASWGGYLALAAATFRPDDYSCAVSFAGPSDLDRELYTGTSFESESVSVWKRRLGSDKDSGKLAAQSPANFAARVKIPVLLLHSDHDTVVAIGQSKTEAEALEHAGKPVEFIKLEGDDHHLEFAETRTRMLKEIGRFLDAHIGSPGADANIGSVGSEGTKSGG